MSKNKSPAVISALTDKSYIVKDVAKDLGFKFKEELVEGGTITKFYFLLTSDETMKLIQSVPRDVYAFSGIVSSGLNDPEVS